MCCDMPNQISDVPKDQRCDTYLHQRIDAWLRVEETEAHTNQQAHQMLIFVRHTFLQYEPLRLRLRSPRE